MKFNKEVFKFDMKFFLMALSIVVLNIVFWWKYTDFSLDLIKNDQTALPCFLFFVFCGSLITAFILWFIYETFKRWFK